MPYHARRFLADLRGVRLWAAALALAGFLAAFFCAWGAGDVGNVVAGGALGGDRHVALSYLRVLDPEEVPLQKIGSKAELEASLLDQPGLATLMGAMAEDDRMFIVLPLGSLTDDYADQGHIQSGIAVIGQNPSWLPVGTAPQGDVLLWGPMPSGTAGVTDTRVGDLPVVRMSQGDLDAQWSGAHAVAYNPGAEAIVLFRPDLARRAGIDVTSTRVSDVVAGFTCACEVDELTAVAAEMTRAARAAGAHRAYYAVSQDQVVGPLGRSGEASSSLTTVALVGVVAGLLLFEHAGAMVFWRRRRRSYGIECRAGAPAWALQLRQQVTFAAVAALPVAVGLWLQDILVGGSGSETPAPWHDHVIPAALLLGLAIQVLVGTSPYLALRRDCRPSTTGGRSA